MKVCEGRITSKFGFRVHPITKEKKFHNGVDIGCAEGTAVYSPVDAIVAQAYNHKTGGNTLILRCADTNDRYAFAHLKEILVEPNKRIKKGTLIAYSGDTGASTGAHLHFGRAVCGYWKDNVCYEFEYIDPTSMIEFDEFLPRAMETR